MGANQSSLSSENNEDSVSAKLSTRHGFQILRVHPNSPVSEAQIFPYFDYIISINGVEVTPDIPNIIGEMARNHVNKPLKIEIYNSRQDEERQVTIVPRSGWGGEGLLGCAIRFCSLDGVRDRVWHILKVHENSPAQKAGLIEEEDYLIASPDLLLNTEDEFYQLVTQNIRRHIKFIVFNGRSEELREIEIVPDFEWGGEGCLGCDVGSGMVHWISNKSITNISNNTSSSTANTSGTANTAISTADTPSKDYTTTPLASAHTTTSTGTNTNTNTNNSMAKIPSPTVPQVNVNIPSARPVVNLFGDDSLNGSNTANSINPIFSESVPSSTLAPPPIITSFINHPHNQNQNQKSVENEDDIPAPNFSVPSDIINQ